MVSSVITSFFTRYMQQQYPVTSQTKDSVIAKGCKLNSFTWSTRCTVDQQLTCELCSKPILLKLGRKETLLDMELETEK